MRHLAAVICLAMLVVSARAGDEPPALALIIDDMGAGRALGRRALALPGPVAFAFLPHAPHARELAGMARAGGNEVLLHQPLEAENGKRLGPGGLTSGMIRERFLRVLRGNLRALPQADGVNNHMGSRLTTEAGPMRWLMAELGARRDLFFVDSRTTADTVALEKARQAGVPSTRRDVFLDGRRDPDYIRGEFRHWLNLARRGGTAVAIAHPHPETLEVLAEELPELERRGFQLVPVSEIIERQKRRQPQWHVSSFPSRTAARKSKPSP